MKEIKEQFEISANPANAGSVRTRLRSVASDAGFNGVALEDFEVAMGEAISNAIIHGSPTQDSIIAVCFTFTSRTNEFSVEVTDQGPGFDPAAVRRTPTDGDVCGRGLRMMASLVDKAVLFYSGTGMTVHLTTRLHPH